MLKHLNISRQNGGGVCFPQVYITDRPHKLSSSSLTFFCHNLLKQLGHFHDCFSKYDTSIIALLLRQKLECFNTPSHPDISGKNRRHLLHIDF